MSQFQEQIAEKMESGFRMEKEADATLAARFPEIHPRLSRIPFLREVALFNKIHGARNLVLLCGILLFFTFIKGPYLGVPFTGEHATKYNTYVEPALYMAQKNDPFWFQQKYTADPVFNPEGVHHHFNDLPLFEWGLSATYKLLPFGNIELKTRIFTHLVGLGCLFLMYLLLGLWVKKDLALLVTFLMSINPIFVFGTFLTVLDSMSLFFGFLALFLLTRYLDTREEKWLYWGGVVFGVGLSVKISMFLWIVPISLLMVVDRARGLADFSYVSILYLLLGAVGIFATKTSIGLLPASLPKGLLGAGAWAIVYVVIFFAIKRYGSLLMALLEKACRRKLILCGIAFGSLLVAFCLFRYSGFAAYTDQFLTDRSLVMDPRLYKYMIWTQFRHYMTENVLWLALIGFLMMLTLKFKNIRWIALAFCVGSLVFWVVASKSMFMHSYYTIILMATLSILAAIPVYYILSAVPSTSGRILVGLLLMLLIVPRSYLAATERISKFEDVSSAVEFVKKNTKPGDMILHEGFLEAMVIYTGRAFVRPYRLVNDQIKNDIQRIGFSETMKKYRIRYFMSPYDKPIYEDFAPLYFETKDDRPSFERSNFIKNLIGTQDVRLQKQQTELEGVIDKYRIREKFTLVAKLGRVRFYSFHE